MGSELELPLQKQPWSSSLRRGDFAAGVGPGPLGHRASSLFLAALSSLFLTCIMGVCILYSAGLGEEQQGRRPRGTMCRLALGSARMNDCPPLTPGQ